MTEEKLKEMAKPNKVGRAIELLQQGWKDEVYGENEYYREGFLDGGLYADEHPKTPWRDAKKDQPKEWENVFVMMSTGTPTCGYRENDDYHLDADYLRGEVAYWMPIPEIKKGE